MNRRYYTTLALTSILTVCFAAITPAQQQGGEQWRAFREKHQYTFQLMQMVRHIGEIDKDKKYTLTPDQAKKVLGVLKPLRAKPKLTQDQAKQALKDLKKIFTAQQLNAMARIKPRFERGRGPGQGPPAGSANRAPRTPPDPNAMKDFNPFYEKAPKDDQRAQERVKRMNEFFAGLDKKAKSKPAAK